MNRNYVSLYYAPADDIRSLERTPSGNFRLQGRGFHISVHPSCITLSRLKRDRISPDTPPFFGLVRLQLVGFDLSLHCNDESLLAAHQAFPMLAYRSEADSNTEVPHGV